MNLRSGLHTCVMSALLAMFLSSASAQQAKTEIDPGDKGGTKGADKIPAPASAKGVQANDPDYVIGVEDVLVINVWHEPEMSRTVSVRPDGKISLPLIGEFDASGLSPKGLQAKLAKQLESLIKNPDVTVIVQEIRSQKFNILGEVSRPGSYPLNKPMTVLDAIAVAGGFKDFANPKKMYILRRSKEGNKKIAVNYNDLIKGVTSDTNFELETRDTVVVP
jgi:polysaccharide export outer membrane protein